MDRGVVVIVRHGRVALIRRQREAQAPYFVFPGGTVEAGETPADAAVREAEEELGVLVRLGRLIATEQHDGRLRHYFLAEITGGTFGTGAGAEMASPAGSARGTYTPVWLPLHDLAVQPVHPPRLAALLAAGFPFETPVRLDQEDGVPPGRV